MSSEEEWILRDHGSECKDFSLYSKWDEKALEAFEHMINIITRFNSHSGLLGREHLPSRQCVVS